MLAAEGQDVIKTMEKIMFVYLFCIKLCYDEKRKEVHMCSTYCALGVVLINCVQQFVFVTNVAIIPFGGLGLGG